LTIAADIPGGLPAAARYHAGQVPQAVAQAVRGAAARWSGPPGWWRLVTVWQWLLTALAVAGVARGWGPSVLAPGERGPVLRDGAAVHRRAAVELHHGRRVSRQQHSSYP